MNHPFRIGESYENTKGSYKVLSISSPKMQIQYEDGSQMTADIAIQMRIWERIQDELASARQEYERGARINRPAITFSGLTDNDFKSNVSGTNWRSREGLAGLVSQQLSNLSGAEFTSGAIYRRPQFFVYPPYLPMFNQAEGVKLPKFVVQLNSEAVLYGFYIEKSDEFMDSGWYWRRFLAILAQTKWQGYLAQAMSEWGINWILRFEEKLAGTEHYKLSADTIISSFGDGSRFLTFSDFVDYLHTLPEKQWCNLYIAKSMEKREAINLKERISQPISQIFNVLAPLYSQLLTQRDADA